MNEQVIREALELVLNGELSPEDTALEETNSSASRITCSFISFSSMFLIFCLCLLVVY